MDKNLFRKESLLKLKKQQRRSNYQKDRYVIEKLYEMIESLDAKNIMLYIPLGIEVDIMPLIKQLREEKRQLFVPFMEGESFRLVKYRLPLIKKEFGTREPKYSKQYRKRVIDLAIVPIVGTDPTLRRVGFGKGMYDRFFAREQKNIKRVIFISRRLSISPQVVTSHYDVAADRIITPEKILIRKKQ
ncbi:MAG: 5-formyltetrahydrofolate cyclo-ligase [Campylobacterota bacterium]|nr:5-formyltetrahydrofolate cyclo-ligase [Campylobacterota bacterium]